MLQSANERPQKPRLLPKMPDFMRQLAQLQTDVRD
jgi:hypothetical protein